MIRQIPGNYSDFSGQNNVEFIEMIVAAVGGRDGTEDIAARRRLYLDLGQLNEDVVPDRAHVYRGRPPRRRRRSTPGDLTPYGRRAGGAISGSVDLFASGRTEDLGLDGLPSSARGRRRGRAALPGRPRRDDLLPLVPRLQHPRRTSAAAPTATPRATTTTTSSTTPTSATQTSSPAGASVQERYAQYLPAFELNSVDGPAGHRALGPGRRLDAAQHRGHRRRTSRPTSPRPSTATRSRSTAPASLSSPFFQNTIQITTGTLARRDVLPAPHPGPDREPDRGRPRARRLLVASRPSASGRPATTARRRIRIASFQLVGSPWLQSTRVGTAADVGADAARARTRASSSRRSTTRSRPTTYARPRQAVYRTTAVASAAGDGRRRSRASRPSCSAPRRSPTAATAGLQRAYTTRPLDLTRYQQPADVRPRPRLRALGLDARRDPHRRRRDGELLRVRAAHHSLRARRGRPHRDDDAARRQPLADGDAEPAGPQLGQHPALGAEQAQGRPRRGRRLAGPGLPRSGTAVATRTARRRGRASRSAASPRSRTSARSCSASATASAGA